MNRYRYRARDAAGAERSGQIDARDSASAMRELLSRELRPLSLELDGSVASGTARKAGAARITASDRIIVLRELATLLAAGVSFAEALPSVADAYRESTLGAVLAKLTAEVNAGGNLARCLTESSLGLPNYALALIEAGDASGELASAMADAAAQMEQDQRIAEEMRNALIYPTILVVVGLIVISAVFIGVVPRFANMLNSSRADIPEFSRQVIMAGVYVKANVGGFGLGLLAVAAALIASFTGSAGKRRLMRIALSTPGVGPWLIESDLGRWATVLSALLANRVEVTSALALSASAVRVDQVATDIRRIATELERGRTLAEAVAGLSWFPHNRVNLIRVGERSGQLSNTLATLGSIHSESARARQRRMLTLIEPAAILVIGAVIGFVMVAVMSAITSVNSVA